LHQREFEIEKGSVLPRNRFSHWFRDVADALALTQTLAARHDAQQALLQAAERTHSLSKERYDRR
jgi:outer membrane protein TolC